MGPLCTATRVRWLQKPVVQKCSACAIARRASQHCVPHAHKHSCTIFVLWHSHAHLMIVRRADPTARFVAKDGRITLVAEEFLPDLLVQQSSVLRDLLSLDGETPALPFHTTLSRRGPSRQKQSRSHRLITAQRPSLPALARGTRRCQTCRCACHAQLSAARITLQPFCHYA